MAKLAFYTLALLKNEYTHPDSKAFIRIAQQVFEKLPTTPGYISMLRRDEHTPAPSFVNKSVHRPTATLTVWKDLRSVFDFSYTGFHAAQIPRKHEWIEPAEMPAYIAWWIGDDEETSYEDAIRRFEYYLEHGNSPVAFTFKSPFDAEGNPTKIGKSESA